MQMRRIVQAMSKATLSPSERDREESEREPINNMPGGSASYDDIFDESEQNEKSDLFSASDLDSNDEFDIDDDDLSLDGLEIVDGISILEPPAKKTEFLADKPPPYTYTTVLAPTPPGPSQPPVQDPFDEELVALEPSHASPFDGPPLLRSLNEKRSPPPAFAAYPMSPSQPAIPPPFHLPPQFSRRVPVMLPQVRSSPFRAPKSRKLCIVCCQRPAYESKGKKYPTCGLTCANILKGAGPLLSPTITGGRNGNNPGRPRSRSLPPDPRQLPMPGDQSCVICMAQPCRTGFVTCSVACAERLCTGGGDPRMCDFCRRRPKAEGHDQCGATCAGYARSACLLCKCRPKHPKYHLCGSTCKQIATKWTPMLLEAHSNHETFKLVEKRFNKVWQGSATEPLPKIKNIYKIFESNAFLRPYDQYKRRVGNEVFRYHGTKRRCKLGSNGNTDLCNATRCHLCQILKTSFKVTLANPRGSFGPGVYSSTASNAAYYYTAGGAGAVIVSKVVLGKTRDVNAFGEVTACPAGFDSVVFDRNNGARNETIVYTDDAIRPVFLIIFN